MSGDAESGQGSIAPSPWPLAVYSVILPRLTPEQGVAAAKEAGYQGMFWRTRASSGPTPMPVQIDGKNACMVVQTPEALSEARRLCEQAGLKVTGLALGPEIYAIDKPGTVERALDLAEHAGAAFLRIQGASVTESQGYTAAYEATIRLCDAYVKAASGRPVKIVVHQHNGTAVASATALHRVISRFDPTDVGCIYDPGNMAVEGYEDYRIGLEILGDYITDIHVKNTRYFGSGKGGVWEWEWSGLHDGLVDLPRLFRALQRTSYRGWVTLSDFSLTYGDEQTLRQGRRVIVQSIRGDEGVSSHTPYRPLDNHVVGAGRP